VTRSLHWNSFGLKSQRATHLKDGGGSFMALRSHFGTAHFLSSMIEQKSSYFPDGSTQGMTF